MAVVNRATCFVRGDLDDENGPRNRRRSTQICDRDLRAGVASRRSRIFTWAIGVDLTAVQGFLMLFPLLFLLGATQAGPTGTTCFICEEIVSYSLTNPQFGNQTEHLLDKFCAYLPPKEQTTCHDVVQKIGLLFEMIAKGFASLDDNAFAICCMINMCSHECCLSDKPEQIHLSYIGDPHTQIGVVWTTLPNVSSVVQYSTNPQNLDKTQTGTVSTFSGGGWIGFMHKVRIHDLQAGTRYYYRVGDGVTWSEVFSFQTEPAEKNRVFQIATIADMGNVNSAGNMRHIQSLVANNQVDFVLHVGDISYADGDQIKWDAYMRTMQNISAYTSYMVTPGNHEIGITGLIGLSLGYINRFILPGDHSISEDLENLYYSFNYGNIHFISLDTESRADVALITKQQLEWFEADLAAVDRKATPWVIVYGHRPFYCSNDDNDCGLEANVLKDLAEGLLNKYEVDLVLTAHKHNYERLWPTKQGGIPVKTYTNPKAPVYIVNGAGGNREGTEHHYKPLDNSVTFLSTWGYAIITSYNSTVLQWDFYDADKGVILDTFTLKVDH